MNLQTVYWYNQGDINNGGYPAIVMADHGDMGLRLHVPLLGTGPNAIKNGCRNVKDPVLEERPILKKNNGAWESAEQYMARLADIEAQAELDREQAKKDREADFKLRAEAAKKLEPVGT